MRYTTLLIFVIALSSCATIMQGTKQSVGISSAPAGAHISIDNAPFGATPMVADLSRKDHHTVKIEMQGYQPFALSMSRGVSGWVVGNIIFGGIIGLAVDAITGGMYKLTPDQISATLAVAGEGLPTDCDLYVTVVLAPDPEWVKIGQLIPE